MISGIAGLPESASISALLSLLASKTQVCDDWTIVQPGAAVRVTPSGKLIVPPPSAWGVGTTPPPGGSWGLGLGRWAAKHHGCGDPRGEHHHHDDDRGHHPPVQSVLDGAHIGRGVDGGVQRGARGRKGPPRPARTPPAW